MIDADLNIPNLLRGKRGLVIGIANDQSIAWGCAKAFHALGAEVAVTYLNDKALPYVEPLARQINAPLLLPLDVLKDGQLEAVFARIAESWGELDFVLHSIAFSPRITAAASITASTMGLYPVQRQTLPCRVNHSLTSSRVGSGLRIRSPLADMMNPGEQKPHCTLAYVMNARCNG